MAWVARSGGLVPQSWEGFFEPLFPLPPSLCILSPSLELPGEQMEGKGRRRGRGGKEGVAAGFGEKKGGGTRGQLFPTGGGRSDIFLKGCVFP